MPKRCLSKCRRLPERECITKERCFYTNGKTHKFCRLKPIYKMDPEKDCAEVLINKTRKVRKAKQPKQPSASVNYEPSANAKVLRTQIAKEAAEKARKKTAAKIIGRFMHKTRHTRKAEFLKSICSDAGVCIAFGTNAANEIKKHFNGFTDFAYVKAPINRIGAPSANGFVNEITYQHRGYQAHAVLKSSIEADADNLMYEYMVGNYINKQNKRFPCFVETYGLYIYQDPSVWTKMKDNKINNDMSLLKSLKQIQSPVNIELACKSSKYLAVLIQHLKGIKSVWDKFRDPVFVSQELLYVLIQVYIPLSLIKDNFTHYDLHSMNVCLYTPVIGKYIEYHYHLGKKEVVFKSQYIAKIIDYGRSYFKDDATKNSKQIYDAVCNEPKCNENPNKCGYDNGFSWLYNPQNEIERKANFYICSQKRSMSHDLRFLNDVLTYTQPGVRPYMMPIKYKIDYGTPELIGSGLSKNIINNVQDAANHFIREVTKPDAIMANEAFYRSQGFTSLGELHIYDDGRPMRYVKA